VFIRRSSYEVGHLESVYVIRSNIKVYMESFKYVILVSYVILIKYSALRLTSFVSYTLMVVQGLTLNSHLEMVR
jgi:hypothetical protein